jgi:transposase
MTWYDISKLTYEQRQHVIVSDYLLGYNAKQIMEMYHMSFQDVARYKNSFIRDNPLSGENHDKLKRED